MSITLKFFEDLQSKNINYCVWKGTEDIKSGLLGLGDIDLFMEYSEFSKFRRDIKEFNVIESITNSCRSHPDIHDYFVLESDGTLIHLQIYTNLWFGSKSKSLDYRFNLLASKVVLDSRYKDEETSIYFIGIDEYIYLSLLRLCILSVNSKNIENEIDEFKIIFEHFKIADLDVEKIREFTTSELIIDIYNIERLLNMSFIDFKHIGNEIFKKPEMFGCKYKSSIPLIFKGWISRFLQMMKKIDLFPSNYHRKLTEGKVVIFLGADGSGKSTQVSRLVKTFKNKINTKYIYMGSGKNETNLIVNLMKLVRSLLKKKSIGDSKNLIEKSKESRRNFSLVLGIYSVILARSKVNKIKLLLKYYNAGYIVICDRFPQSSVVKSNDGPLIQHYNNSRKKMHRILAAYELKCYNYIAEAYSIDTLLIRFVANDLSKVYERRKDEMCFDSFSHKHKENMKIKFNNKNMHAEIIDCSLNLNAVNYEVNNLVQKYLAKPL